jgi:hypothetical protein
MVAVEHRFAKVQLMLSECESYAVGVKSVKKRGLSHQIKGVHATKSPNCHRLPQTASQERASANVLELGRHMEPWYTPGSRGMDRARDAQMRGHRLELQQEVGVSSNGERADSHGRTTDGARQTG